MLGKRNSITLEEYNDIITKLSGEVHNIENISAEHFDSIINSNLTASSEYKKCSSNLEKFKFVFTQLTDKEINKLIKAATL